MTQQSSAGPVSGFITRYLKLNLDATWMSHESGCHNSPYHKKTLSPMGVACLNRNFSKIVEPIVALMKYARFKWRNACQITFEHLLNFAIFATFS